MTKIYSRPADCKAQQNLAFSRNQGTNTQSVTCGLYVNIILNDYLRTILNLNRNPINSDWKLDPRESIPNVFDPQGTPRGVGNQVSVEFNMIYRWHSAISDNDEAWANDFFAEVFGADVDPSRRSSRPLFLSWLSC